MTYFHYYATTSRNLDRVLQYGVYPVAQVIGFAIGTKLFGAQKEKVNRFSSDFARVASAGTYSVLTTTFLGAESEMIDHNSRLAVSAEMGIDPDRLTFSDYKYSKNAIVSKAHNDMLRLQKYRYGTDMLFVLPTLLRLGSKGVGYSWPESGKIDNDPFKYNWMDHLANGHVGWNMSVYAGKAIYWAGETYFIDKSGHYEIVKLIETLEATGKDMDANDLWSVYQRGRTDRGQEMVEHDNAAAYNAMRPLLQRMAAAYNKHDGHFGMSEIVYLMGLGKINVFAADDKTVSNEAIERSNQEIDKVLTIGLKGIREEKKRMREMHGVSGDTAIHPKGFSDRFSDGAIGMAQSFVKAFRKKPYRHEEYLSVRNPGELTNIGYSR
jgi:hypothetical protein